MELTIRTATLDDLPAIQEIYNRAIRETTATWDEHEWPWEARLGWWDEHQDPTCPVIVADSGGAVAGFAALSPMSKKSGWRFTRENTVYVDPSRHRQGLGRALMAELIARARDAGLHLVVASITADNESSLALHRSLGFEDVGVLREAGWKFGKRHDTAYLQLVL